MFLPGKIAHRQAVGGECVSTLTVAPVDVFGLFVVFIAIPATVGAVPHYSCIGVGFNRDIGALDGGKHQFVAVGKILAAYVVGVGERHIGSRLALPHQGIDAGEQARVAVVVHSGHILLGARCDCQ